MESLSTLTSSCTLANSVPVCQKGRLLAISEAERKARQVGQLERQEINLLDVHTYISEGARKLGGRVSPSAIQHKYDTDGEIRLRMFEVSKYTSNPSLTVVRFSKDTRVQR